MTVEPEKILVIESEESSRRRLEQILVSAGYQVTSPSPDAEGLKGVVELEPALLVMDAEPERLDCCSLISELKGSPSTGDIRIILLTDGGPAERTRGLDLGADDVLSRPWDAAELLARVRGQLRAGRAQIELRQKVRHVEENEDADHAALEALAASEATTRQTSSLARTLERALLALFLLAAAGGLVFFLFYRHSQKEVKIAFAAISRQETGFQSEQQLVARSMALHEEMKRDAAESVQTQKQQLEKESQHLRTQMSTAQTEQVTALRREILQTNLRLERLENEDDAAQRIIRTYAKSVCLIHVIVGFRDKETGKRLRFSSVDAQGEPPRDSKGNVLMTTEGTGPEVRMDAFGTGFLVGPGRRVLTNHHVVEPWWGNDDLAPLIQQDVQPFVAGMQAYFPGIPRGFPLKVQRISTEADLAVVEGNFPRSGLRTLKIDTRPQAAVSGQAVVLLGYATGLEAILARTAEATVQKIAESSNGDPSQILSGLARRDLVSPLSTQGHIGDVLRDKIVYDAQTTFGGSGGPLFNAEGKVIGVNYAILQGFGGSNFAIPIRYAEPLLAR
jgi:serine protease Do